MEKLLGAGGFFRLSHGSLPSVLGLLHPVSKRG